MKRLLVAFGLCLLAAPVEAARSPEFPTRCRYILHGMSTMDGRGAVLKKCWAIQPRKIARTVHHHRYAVSRVAVRRYRNERTGHGNLCTEQGRCATVVSWAADRFRSLVHEFEHMGYAIGSPGCLSAGHMAHSKHHWGGACDLFNQYARNRTLLRQPPPRVQIEVAERHGLTSGCIWHNPDCGHFEVPSRTYARAY